MHHMNRDKGPRIVHFDKLDCWDILHLWYIQDGNLVAVQYSSIDKNMREYFQ